MRALLAGAEILENPPPVRGDKMKVARKVGKYGRKGDIQMENLD
jgi:hypothetical protein